MLRATTRPAVSLCRTGCILTLVGAVFALFAVFDAMAGGQMQAGGTGRVQEVVDGDTIILASGDRVRLVGIQAPKLPLGRTGFAAWPLAAEAKAAMAELVLGKTVHLSFGGRRRDRHGRLLAHLHDESGLWVQGEMLARGLARVYSFADNRALVAEMLRLERQARSARRGIWGSAPALRDFYAIRSATEASRFANSFQLVEGRVRAVASVRGTVYLNFGNDWRRDFTVVLRPAARRLFRKADLDPSGYEGRLLRIRGWIRTYNGPMIEATHPEQIEVLE